ncbi:class I SAM-dependent methyltransferase [Segetibacter sp. 3557_3]|uniref:class I SAM-dependent methyltransferase n=1 Tax=Segetibacter sp. 3557_3 TaxID=2547429 RepID=UPI001058F6EF|nr:class I SAM-dependent methyltransferase [Segetibacter sp. 3557_3]TDH25481.1 class I SAM-dependent methyltransferase [Segetibacter sp. 3557_3]
MPEVAWFENWFSSPYYHLLYQHRDDDEAFLFIGELIRRLSPLPGSRMLDVACGKGRHSKVLAEHGFDVTGIDLSFESIQEALESEDDNLHFYQHDMRLPFWIHYFDYAFNFFTSFGYFKTRRENDNAVRTIAQSLKSEGYLVMDYLNVHYAEDHLVKDTIKEIDNVKFHITKWDDEDHFYKQVQIEDNGVLMEHKFTEKVAKFSLGDFNDMFAYQGLQIQEVFGDYHFGHYDVRKSPRLIMIAKKIRD